MEVLLPLLADTDLVCAAGASHGLRERFGTAAAVVVDSITNGEGFELRFVRRAAAEWGPSVHIDATMTSEPIQLLFAKPSNGRPSSPNVPHEGSIKDVHVDHYIPNRHTDEALAATLPLPKQVASMLRVLPAKDFNIAFPLEYMFTPSRDERGRVLRDQPSDATGRLPAIADLDELSQSVPGLRVQAVRFSNQTLLYSSSWAADSALRQELPVGADDLVKLRVTLDVEGVEPSVAAERTNSLLAAMRECLDGTDVDSGWFRVESRRAGQNDV